MPNEINLMQLNNIHIQSNVQQQPKKKNYDFIN